MAKTDQYTAQQMIDALIEAKGMVTIAARKVPCTYRTMKRYIDKYPSVAQAQKEQREQMGDAVELALYDEAVNKRNTAALIFLAKTQFKDRGYVERQEIANPDGSNLTWEVVYRNLDDRNPDEDTP
jgi:hypothetical protein